MGLGSEEQNGNSLTALDDLNRLLKPESTDFAALYNSLIEDPDVKKSGQPPSEDQFRKYLEITKAGLEYNKRTYGMAAIPGQFSLIHGAMVIDGKPIHDHISFNYDNNRLGVSALHVALECTSYNNSKVAMTDRHLPDTRGVRAEDHTLLQTIEEGYHRYQEKVLRINPREQAVTYSEMNELEKGIKPVWEKAIQDLKINLIPVIPNNRDRL